MQEQELAADGGAVTQGSAPSAHEMRTPKEWAAEFFPMDNPRRIHPELWRHGAAAALHQWKAHEFHLGAPIQLTRDQYQAALKAAEVGNPVPHAPAFSRHAKGA